jgi:hypothetical protein
MSKIAIQGAVTGTGVFTLASPATNTNRTLTLPDEAGTVLVNGTTSNVGIGTSSPAHKLDISGTAYGGVYIKSTSTNFSGMLIENTNSATKWQVGVEGGAYVGAGIFNIGIDAVGSKLAIDSSGNLLVGTTSAAGTSVGSGFQVQSNGGTGSTINIGHPSSAGSGFSYALFAYNNGFIGSIGQSGTTAVAYNTTSDYRLKENITPLTSALARIVALKPCTYTWKSAPDEVGEGFIAHELAEVCPQAVTGEKDAVDAEGNPQYQGIDTSFLVATLTAAIQEQQAIIESLTARVVALEGQP